MRSLGVCSEIGLLRKVLVHRPGVGLERVTSKNRDALSFDSVLWVERACEEHNAFVHLMQQQDVDVLYLDDLLEQTLGYPDARDWLLDRRIHPGRLGVDMAVMLREWLDNLSAHLLVKLLIGGIMLSELPFKPPIANAAIMAPDGFVLEPLPNQMFTQDSSSWIFGGVTLNPLAPQSRLGEGDNIAVIYHFHPSFETEVFKIWWGHSNDHYGRVGLEGGDVMVAGQGKVILCANAYNSPHTIAALARSLLSREAVEEVVVVRLPNLPNHAHFNLAFCLCRKDLALVCPPLLEAGTGFSLRTDKSGKSLVVSQHEGCVIEITRRALGVKKLHTIEFDTPGDDNGRWDRGTGVLVLRPGMVISFERNAYANAKLRKAGIDVLPLASSELCRSGGGPQRLVCALQRDPVND